MSYNYTPVYKPFEPFKKLIKSNSKWFDILKKFGFNWLPQNVSFNTEITRHYHELQERDMEDLGGSQLPLIFSEQFLWNRDFSIRWDLTKNIHMNFQSATHAEIEEPYTPINKDLYPDQYSAWKDSVKTSLRHFGTPLDYNQSFKLSYLLPLNLIPIFDWVNADANYTSTYRWIRGTDLDDGTSLGNTISNSRDLNINGAFNMECLYNQIPFLKKTNERFNKAPKKTQPKKTTASNTKKGNDDKGKEQKELPKNQRSFEKEITLLPDTTISVSHGRKSKRLIVSAKTSDGKTFRLRYRTDGQDKVFLVREAVKRHSAIDFLSNADQATLAALRTVAWFVDCGDDDFLLQLSMDFHMKMREVKVHNELRVRNGVHNWEYWHLALRMSLPFASRNFGEN